MELRTDIDLLLIIVVLAADFLALRGKEFLIKDATRYADDQSKFSFFIKLVFILSRMACRVFVNFPR